MKKSLLFGICFLLFGIFSQAQGFADRRKTLSDSEYVAGDIVKLPMILYDLGKATLRPESMDSLKIIFAFLDSLPYLAVEISNHTDTRTSPTSSSRLSSARAKMVMDSLIKLGIDPKRLTAKGYEGTKPMVPETMIKKLPKADQEKAHAINRRTELKIINTNFTK